MALRPDNFRYQATLTSSTGAATPGFSNVQISFSGTGSNTSTLMVYAYDNAGNITSKTTVTDSGTATDVRDNPSWASTDRINSLNQIKRQDVGGVTWTYGWNADGTLASKAGGGNTWGYTWDSVDGQRLINVKLNGTIQVAFSYDTMGRMLTRTPYSGGVAGGATSFIWDGFNCVKESSSTSTTRYYCPQGELQSFERDGVTYQCHTDGLRSIRLVTDNTGAVKAQLDYDAWGNLLSNSTDNVPGGFPYRFVGALGCRTDATTGLIYMRQRWFDPQLQRFASRDVLGLGSGSNPYAYCYNDPINYIDYHGLDRVAADWSTKPTPNQEATDAARKEIFESSYGAKWQACLAPVLATYKIQYAKSAEKDLIKRDNLGGVTYFAQKLIVINDDYDQASTVLSIFHELLHPVFRSDSSCRPKIKRTKKPGKYTLDQLYHILIYLFESRLAMNLYSDKMVFPSGLLGSMFQLHAHDVNLGSGNSFDEAPLEKFGDYVVQLGFRITW